jgi:hypothetical protein
MQDPEEIDLPDADEEGNPDIPTHTNDYHNYPGGDYRYESITMGRRTMALNTNTREQYLNQRENFRQEGIVLPEYHDDVHQRIWSEYAQPGDNPRDTHPQAVASFMRNFAHTAQNAAFFSAYVQRYPDIDAFDSFTL